MAKKNAAAQEQAVKTEVKKMAKKQPAEKKEPEVVEGTTLKSLCEELDIKPAAARIKLRKHFGEARKIRYVFNDDEVGEIRDVLTKEPERKVKEEKTPKAEAAPKATKKKAVKKVTEEEVAEEIE